MYIYDIKRAHSFKFRVGITWGATGRNLRGKSSAASPCWSMAV